MRKQWKLFLFGVITVVLFLTACTVNDYKAVFYVDGEEYALTAFGDGFKLPPEPTKEGFFFDGWYLDDGVWSKPFTEDMLKTEKITQDLKIYAKWEAGDGFSDDVFTYHLFVDGVGYHWYSISGVKDKGLTEAIIPETFRGKKVTGIDENAFRGCGLLTRVVIPASVTFIGSEAFSDCNGLTEVEISDIAAWCEIRFGVVWGDYSNPLSYAEHLYLNGEEVTEVIVPDGVTKINTGAFFGFGSLKSIVIPNTVTSIGSYAFYGTGLWNDTAKNNVVYADKWAVGYQGTINGELTLRSETSGIASQAFNGSNFTSIVIPSSVKYISGGSFLFCDSLTIYAEAKEKPDSWNRNWNSDNCPIVWDCINNDTAEDGNAYYIDGNGMRFGIKDGAATVVKQPRNITGQITIPSYIAYKGDSYRVTSVGAEAFEDCRSIQTVVIPESVTSIGNRAFSYCDSLIGIEIPKSVTSIAYQAFRLCSNLSDINYRGTKAEWNGISKGYDGIDWILGTSADFVECSDGNVWILG